MSDEAAAAPPLPAARSVPLGRPLRWLRLGWRDFTRVPLPSALHGFLMAAFGLALLALAHDHAYLLAGAFSGFLLVAPILVTGLYELSRALARGEPADLSAVIAAWRSGSAPLIAFGLTLAVIGTFWVLLSAVLIALLAPAQVTDVESFVRHVLLARDSNLFLVWLLAGGLLAAVVFAGTVVAVPLLLDRDIGLAEAVVTSVQVVAENPLPMALWATLIMLITGLGMATLLLGLVLAIPVLGHASWHAYADLVDTGALPPRRRP
jgi:uncharacterized membrane protein